MKLDYKNTITAYNAGRLRSNTNAKQNSNPFFKKDNDINFTGDFTRVVDSAAKKIVYSNMGEISAKIDAALGDRFFSKTLEEAGLTIVSDKLQIPNMGILHDIFRTLKYPIIDLPLDLANWIAGGLKKVSFLSGIGEKIQSFSVLQRRAKAFNVEKSLETVNEILDSFANHKAGSKIENGLRFSLENCAENFNTKVASNVTKLAKNYNSRDERTLNRIATATVSSVYGMWDFHNISMLQKDDKKAAKKAGKSRFKQEMTRMAFNAGTTFLTMGVLNKYIKNSMALSVTAIAVSALFSEVVSRILNKKPLHPLSPQEARKIALKQHPELAEKLKHADEKSEYNDNVNFKQKLEDTNRIFVQFQSKDGTTPAMKCLHENKTQDKKPKKILSPRNIILGAFGVASAAYLISSVLKGEFQYRKDIKALYDRFKEDMPMDKVAEFLKTKKASSEKFSIFDPVRKFLTTKKETVHLDDLASKLTELQETPSGQKIQGTLSDYIERINEIATREGNDYVINKSLIFREGIYNGFSRLFDSIYTVLSAPGRLINIILDGTIFKKSNKAAEAVEARLPQELKMKKVVASLSGIISKAKDNESVANEIMRATQKFDSGPETGKLASLARTMVTAISTYFFVNDYTNSVLIESAGKDTRRAKTERNERLAHKGANFVINGTLMNLFNSIFVKQLNGSLLGATAVATATEMTNEFLVRKSICQPVLPRGSKQEIIDYEQKQMSKKGILGAWSRFFKKVTGKKSLTQKTGITDKKN